MKNFFSFHSVIKALSFLLMAAVPVMRCFLCGSTDLLCDIAVGFASASCIVILLPVSGEGIMESLAFAAVYFLIVILFSAVVENMLSIVLFSSLFVLIYLCFRLHKKYKKIRALFRNEEVWQCVEENARWVYVSAYFLLCTMLCLASVTSGGMALIVGVFAIYYAVMLLRSYLANTFFMSAEGEAIIRKIIKGTLRPENPLTLEEEDVARKGRLYEKIQQIMETKRPYLDEDFSLQDLASASFTNKTYLSKTINLFSGRNFRQYVNYYRVQYSIELMKRDKHLRISELSEMSGFHTVVTYNMAFKLNMNETPSDYLQKIRLDLD